VGVEKTRKHKQRNVCLSTGQAFLLVSNERHARISQSFHSRINSIFYFSSSGRYHKSEKRRQELFPGMVRYNWSSASFRVVGVSTLIYVKHQKPVCCLLWKFVITFFSARNKSTHIGPDSSARQINRSAEKISS
jgi:hypothetical protein